MFVYLQFATTKRMSVPTVLYDLVREYTQVKS